MPQLIIIPIYVVNFDAGGPISKPAAHQARIEAAGVNIMSSFVLPAISFPT